MAKKNVARMSGKKERERLSMYSELVDVQDTLQNMQCALRLLTETFPACQHEAKAFNPYAMRAALEFIGRGMVNLECQIMECLEGVEV